MASNNQKKKDGRMLKYFEYIQNGALLTNALLYLLIPGIKIF